MEGQQQVENEPEAQNQQALVIEDDEDEDEEDDILMVDDEDQVTNVEESLLMRFCPHDSSMLYPQVSG